MQITQLVQLGSKELFLYFGVYSEPTTHTLSNIMFTKPNKHVQWFS